MTNTLKNLAFAIAFVLILAGTAQANGMFTFVFDDGFIGTYENALPVLKRYGFKGVSGVVYTKAISGNPDYMNLNQLAKLQAEGWEIASHGYTHKRPYEIPPTADKEPLRNWRKSTRWKGMYKTEYDFPIIGSMTQNGVRLRAEASPEEAAMRPGGFYLDTVAQEVFVRPNRDADPNTQDMRVISYEGEMERSRAGLEAHGLRVKSYVTPYNYWLNEHRSLARPIYDQVAAGGDGYNYRETFDPYFIRRIVIHEKDSVEQIAKVLKEEAVDKNAWVVVCMHEIGSDLGWEPWSVEKLDALCAWLKTSGVRVATLAEGAAAFKTATK